MGYNMFAYCNNNPVMYHDSFGQLPLWIAIVSITAIVLAVVAAVHVHNAAVEEESEFNSEEFDRTVGVIVDNPIPAVSNIQNVADLVDITTEALDVVKKGVVEKDVKRAIMLNMLLYNEDPNTPILNFGLYDYDTYCNNFRADAAHLKLASEVFELNYAMGNIDSLVEHWNQNAHYIQSAKTIYFSSGLAQAANSFLELYYTSVLDMFSP